MVNKTETLRMEAAAAAIGHDEVIEELEVPLGLQLKYAEEVLNNPEELEVLGALARYEREVKESGGDVEVYLQELYILVLLFSFPDTFGHNLLTMQQFSRRRRSRFGYGAQLVCLDFMFMFVSTWFEFIEKNYENLYNEIKLSVRLKQIVKVLFMDQRDAEGDGGLQSSLEFTQTFVENIEVDRFNADIFFKVGIYCGLLSTRLLTDLLMFCDVKGFRGKLTEKQGVRLLQTIKKVMPEQREYLEIITTLMSSKRFSCKVFQKAIELAALSDFDVVKTVCDAIYCCVKDHDDESIKWYLSFSRSLGIDVARGVLKSIPLLSPFSPSFRSLFQNLVSVIDVIPREGLLITALQHLVDNNLHEPEHVFTIVDSVRNAELTRFEPFLAERIEIFYNQKCKYSLNLCDLVIEGHGKAYDESPNYGSVSMDKRLARVRNERKILDFIERRTSNDYQDNKGDLYSIW
jgi:hypothetical protein